MGASCSMDGATAATPAMTSILPAPATNNRRRNGEQAARDRGEIAAPLPRPEPFGNFAPGEGEAVPGEMERHKFLGDDLQKIRCTAEPSPGWDQRLGEHTRYYNQEVDKLRRGDPHLATANKMHEELHRLEASRLLLAAWPRGNGPGEILHVPVVDDTPARNRGVKVEWWMAVCDRAAFVPTRIFVEAFVKPTTRAAACALWFFIPERFRARPEPPHGVFISHAWDLSMYDIRPPPSSVMWLDALAIVQHRKAVGAGASAEEAFPELLELIPAIEQASNTLLIVGGGSLGPSHALLPLARSWCLYEIAHTPVGKLHVRVGWTPWKFEEQEGVAQALSSLDVAKAQSFDPEDKRMIDRRVEEKFGSFSAANDVIRKAAMQGYFTAVLAVYQPPPPAGASREGASADGELSHVMEAKLKLGHSPNENDSSFDRVASGVQEASFLGHRPLFDKRIVGLFVGGDPENGARWEKLDRQPSWGAWEQKVEEERAVQAPYLKRNPLYKFLADKGLSQITDTLQEMGVEGIEDLRECLVDQEDLAQNLTKLQTKKLVTALNTFEEEVNRVNPKRVIISHIMRNRSAAKTCKKLRSSLIAEGYSVEVITDKDAALIDSMEDVACFIPFLTGFTKQASDYLSTGACDQLLRMAFDAKVPVQPVIPVAVKKQIGSILADAPSDTAKQISGIDLISLDGRMTDDRHSDERRWDSGVQELVRSIARGVER